MSVQEVVKGKKHMLEVNGEVEETTFTGEKVWIIFDGRARAMDTDDCAVYEVFNSIDETVEDVHRAIKEDWEDGVIFEYDEVVAKDGKKYIINQKQLN